METQLLYLCSVDVDHVEVHRDQRAKQEQKNSEAEPGERAAAASAASALAAATTAAMDDATVFSYMVVQMLRSMKKTAASSCRIPRLIFRPKMVSKPMLRGMTGRGRGSSQKGALSIHVRRPPALTRNLRATSPRQLTSSVW